MFELQDPEGTYSQRQIYRLQQVRYIHQDLLNRDLQLYFLHLILFGNFFDNRNVLIRYPEN